MSMSRTLYKIIDGMKICTGCHENLPERQYGVIKKKNGKHVQKAKCKACLQKKTEYWRYNHREKYYDTRRRYNERNKERIKARSYIQHAGYRSIIVELSENRFIQLFQQPCYYCGTTGSLNGVDRLDNTKGYVEGNVVSSCLTCNRAKNKMSQEEFLSWIKRIAVHQGF